VSPPSTIAAAGGVVSLSGTVPSERQRQVAVQLVADGLGLDALDRLRVMALDREGRDTSCEPKPAGVPDKDRIPFEAGLKPVGPERSTVPEDEGEPADTVSDQPLPEEE
jgi:hypothetical protein